MGSVAGQCTARPVLLALMDQWLQSHHLHVQAGMHACVLQAVHWGMLLAHHIYTLSMPSIYPCPGVDWCPRLPAATGRHLAQRGDAIAAPLTPHGVAHTYFHLFIDALAA